MSKISDKTDNFLLNYSNCHLYLRQETGQQSTKMQ